jgi:hypothetical protein
MDVNKAGLVILRIAVAIIELNDDSDAGRWIRWN